MAFERELIAAMWNVEAARAWRMAGICAETSDSHLQVVLVCFEQNEALDQENDNLVALLCVTANEVGRLRCCLARIQCFVIGIIGLVAVWLWAVALTVLK